MAKLSKRQIRNVRNEQKLEKNNSLNLIEIRPKTENQVRIFEEFKNNHLMVHGYPGTGKTFVLLYLALREVLSGRSQYNKIKIFRSAVATRNIGFLPGNVDDKMESFEAPYIDICAELLGRNDAYGILKHKGIIEFIPTSYIRGCTYNDCIIIVDECQNLNWHEACSIATRVGIECKLIFSGDSGQSDFTGKEKVDIHKLIRICGEIDKFVLIQMEIDDIVRSGFVRDWIEKVVELGYAI